jgi:hypothetical protein
MTRRMQPLYDRLPAIIRIRDAEQSKALCELLDVIQESFDLLEEDIARLYDNWFIETCEDWAVPYIGELVAYRPPADTIGALPGPLADLARREIGRAIAFRRRKGTLGALEEVTAAAGGWPALAREAFRGVMIAQGARHPRPDQARFPDIRDSAALDRLGGAFDAASRMIDVRHPASRRTPGSVNVPNVLLYVSRLFTFRITDAPAASIEAEGANSFTFSALGHDTALRGPALADRASAPHRSSYHAPISRQALSDDFSRPVPQLYGADKAFAIYAPHWPARDAPQPVPTHSLRVADLSDWRYEPRRNEVLVDPVRGRLKFPSRQQPRSVSVSYLYGFPGPVGGGEYPRPVREPVDVRVFVVGRDQGQHRSVAAALAAWRASQEKDPPDAKERRSAVIELAGSFVWSEPLDISLGAGEYLQIRAAPGARPVIRLLDYVVDAGDAFRIMGRAASRFVLDGITVVGRGLLVEGPDPGDREAYAAGDLCDVTIRHCTLVPGWSLECDCTPKRPNEPSIVLMNSRANLTLEHSISGAIEVAADEVLTEPIRLVVENSILDPIRSRNPAIRSSSDGMAFARVEIRRSTVLGGIDVHVADLVEDTIILGALRATRRRQGCIRYSYTGPGSRTPPRFQCQPDLAERDARESLGTGEDLDNALALARFKVRPAFVSRRYGSGTYAQLEDDADPAITEGAQNRSEMGVWNDLYRPQRRATMAARLVEFSPAGAEVGIVFMD